MARYGHVTGHKKERKHAQDWYREREEELIRQVEREWQERQARQAEVRQED